MQKTRNAPSQEALADARRSVRSLRIALALCGLILALFALIVGLVSWNAVYSREQRYMLSLAEVTERSLDAYFQSLEIGLASLRREIADPAGKIDFALLPSALKGFKDAYPDLRLVFITRVDGLVLASSEGGEARRVSNFADYPSFVRSRQEILAGQNMSVGRPLRSSVSGDWVIPVRYGARDTHGRVAFMISLGLPITKPQSFWKDVALPDRAALSLIHADGSVLARYPVPASVSPEEVFQQPLSPTVQAYHERHREQRTGWFEDRSRITDAHSMIAYQRLAHYPLTVQVINPKVNAWREWWRDTQLDLVLILAMLLAGSVIYRWAVRRQLAWELERAQRIIELTRANHELEDFTYTVSHDLRAPLRAVDGYAAILREDLGTPLPAEQDRALEKIRDSAQRMGHLIDSLLAFAQRSRQPLQKQEVDVAALVRRVLADEMPRDAAIELTIGNLPSCRADGQLLEQVWRNLISNAIKFSAGAQPPVIEIGHADGAYFVRDNGTGFDMAHARSLFGMFSHLNSAGQYDGSGTGLATVKRVLERHGGSVWAQSAPHQGATFYFRVD